MSPRGFPLCSGLVLGLVACSCSSSDESNGTSAACNSLVNDGPLVTITVVASDAPAPAGGTITDGTYELSALTKYTGVNGSTAPVAGNARVVFTIAGRTMQQIMAINGQGGASTATLSVSGTTMTTTVTCPAPSSSALPFTATASELRVYEVRPDSTFEQTYRRR